MPVLIDSSAWIEFLRRTGSRANIEVRDLLGSAADGDVVMCEPVAMELLAGPTDEVAVRRLERLVDGLPTLAVDPSLDFRAAAAIFRATRRRGRGVRGTVDCLVAAVAIRHDVVLVHADRDFETIADVAPLRHESLR